MVKTTSRGTWLAAAVEVDAFFLHAVANGLEDGEAAVALVEMQNARRDAHGLEGAKAADAEQQFLADAGAAVAAVEARGEFAVFGGVALDIGVEQQQVDAAHFDAPDLGANGAAAGFNLHDDGFAVLADGRLHGQLIDVGLQILFPLPAVASRRCRKYPWP